MVVRLAPDCMIDSFIAGVSASKQARAALSNWLRSICIHPFFPAQSAPVCVYGYSLCESAPNMRQRQPPETTSVSPVMYGLSARKRTAAATSAGVPARPSGISAQSAALSASERCAFILVSM